MRYLLALLWAFRAFGQPGAPAWPDTYTGRLEVLALLQTLNSEILANRSATLTLERWCRSHELASDPKIVAEREPGAGKQATAEQRAILQVAPDEEVKHRQVRLRCGTHVLSEADNWYVPGRLTPAMNRLLESSDTPFGKAVQPLEPYRRTLSARLLWSPLPEGWENGAAMRDSPERGALVIPDALFTHRAVLYSQDRQPFSLVEEVYKRALLAFPRVR